MENDSSAVAYDGACRKTTWQPTQQSPDACGNDDVSLAEVSATSNESGECSQTVKTEYFYSSQFSQWKEGDCPRPFSVQSQHYAAPVSVDTSSTATTEGLNASENTGVNRESGTEHSVSDSTFTKTLIYNQSDDVRPKISQNQKSTHKMPQPRQNKIRKRQDGLETGKRRVQRTKTVASATVEESTNRRYVNRSNPGNPRRNPHPTGFYPLNTGNDELHSDVLVRMSQRGTIPKEKVKEYLQRLCGKKLKFTIEEIRNGDSPEIVCRFGGRKNAKELIQLLNRSSHETGVKATWRTTACPIMSEDELRCFKDKEWRTMNAKAETVLKDHKEKIRKVQELVTGMKVNKHVPAEEFFRLTQGREAHQQKLDELESQDREFQKFVQVLKGEIDNMNASVKVEFAIREIQRRFALELNKVRTPLPIYAKKSEIMHTTQQSQVTIILGETGSGKSTQTTQFLCQTDLATNGLIVCTQPRKVAAISLAQHVANEMGSHVGGLVGYKVGMSVKQCKDTKVIYVTNNVLLNECIHDPLLRKYSCIILDEAHERSIYCDLLLGMIKQALADRPDLRLIVMSATIDPQIFVRYFEGMTPIVKVSGRTFPVDVQYEEACDLESDDYVEDAVAKAFLVHRTEAAGDILVFLTSPVETEKAVRRFPCICTDKDTVCMELHGKLQPQEQQKVFEPVKTGQRKIIFCTNVAETSVTIPGVKYVIDSGFAKEMVYDPKRNMNSLKVECISRSAAEQRKGRAGRLDCGKCFRLYSEDIFNHMNPASIPEILRSHLGQTLLKLLALGVSNPLAFDYVESPPKESLKIAMSSLEELGAVTDGKLTVLGLKLAKLSIEPRLAKLILRGNEEGIGLDALAVASVYSAGGNMFYRAGTEAEKKRADALKMRFCHENGDMLTLLQVYREWSTVEEQGKNSWCMENSINAKSMRAARENLKELKDILTRELSLKIENNFQDMAVVEAIVPNIILECFSSNLCHYSGHPKVGYIPVRHMQRGVQVHPSSAMLMTNQQPQWVVYGQILSTSRDFLINVSALDNEDVLNHMGQWTMGIIEAQLQQKMVEAEVIPGIGNSVMRQLIGPRGSGIRSLEEKLFQLEAGNTTSVVVEASRNEGTVTVYTHSGLRERCKEIVLNTVQPYITEIEKETRELSLEARSPIRCVIEKGFRVRTILMPGEYRTIVVKHVPNEMVDEEILAIFACFGDVEGHVRLNKYQRRRNLYWGKVTFVDHKSAENVFAAWEGKDENLLHDMDIFPDCERSSQAHDSDAKVRVSWLRRPMRGFGFVEMKDTEDVTFVLYNRAKCLPVIDNHIVRCSKCRKNPVEIFVSNLPKVGIAESELKTILKETFQRPIKEIRFPREKVPPTVTTDVQVYTSILQRKIEEVTGDGHKFQLEMLTPKEMSYETQGFIYFKSYDDAQEVADALNQTVKIGGMPVKFDLQLHTVTIVPQRIYTVIKSALEKCCKDATRTWGDRARVDIQPQAKGNNMAVHVNAKDVRCLADVKTEIGDLVSGTTIDTITGQQYDSITFGKGREFLDQLTKDCKVEILTDRRQLALRILGPKNRRQRAEAQLRLQLDQLKSAVSKEIKLAGSGRPGGLAKHLMGLYGNDLEILRQLKGVDHVEIVLNRHILRVHGNSQSVDEIATEIEEAANLLSQKQNDNEGQSGKTIPKMCPICLDDIDVDQYRLERCGHAYCKVCIKRLFDNAKQSNEFPLCCAQEGCKKELVLHDFTNLIGTSFASVQPFVVAALSRFVAENKDAYRYCPSPDCPIVYRSSNDGKRFQCPSCFLSVCTTCHEPYHEGLRCDMYQGMKHDNDFGLKKWLNDDRTNRVLCPGCRAPIEKTGGCQHMQCSVCHVHICWNCLRTFDSAGGCYDHLRAECGGIFSHDYREAGARIGLAVEVQGRNGRVGDAHRVVAADRFHGVVAGDRAEGTAGIQGRTNAAGRVITRATAADRHRVVSGVRDEGGVRSAGIIPTSRVQANPKVQNRVAAPAALGRVRPVAEGAHKTKPVEPAVYRGGAVAVAAGRYSTVTTGANKLQPSNCAAGARVAAGIDAYNCMPATIGRVGDAHRVTAGGRVVGAVAGGRAEGMAGNAGRANAAGRVIPRAASGGRPRWTRIFGGYTRYRDGIVPAGRFWSNPAAQNRATVGNTLRAVAAALRSLVSCCRRI